MMQPVRNDRIARLVEWQRFVLTEEGRSEFLQRLGVSGNVSEVCRDMDLPESMVLAFLASQVELREDAKAILELKVHQMVAEGLEIVDDREDDPDAASRRVRSDYRLKVAEKWAKGMYGPRVAVERNVTVVVDAGLVGRAMELLTSAGAASAGGGRLIEGEK